MRNETYIKRKSSFKHFEKIFGMLFMVLTGLILFNSQIFMVKEVEIIGNNLLSAEEILLQSQISTYLNIFQVDSKKVSQAILKDFRIASVQISKKLPDKIEITVKERNPVLLVMYLNNLVLIGNDGIVMGVKEEMEPIKLPVVTGLAPKPVKLGEAISNPQFKVAMEILGFADDYLNETLSEINLKNYQLYLDLPGYTNTVKVELGSEEYLEKKISNLRSILIAHLSSKNLVSIDLRLSDLPTVITSSKIN